MLLKGLKNFLNLQNNVSFSKIKGYFEENFSYFKTRNSFLKLFKDYLSNTRQKKKYFNKPMFWKNR